MTSEFITRVEHGKDEPYTVIFRTDDADKYKHIEDECRRMIGHEKPTVDAVQVVRCRECKWFDAYGDTYDPYCDHKNHRHEVRNDFYCADGERRTDEQ